MNGFNLIRPLNSYLLMVSGLFLVINALIQFLFDYHMQHWSEPVLVLIAIAILAKTLFRFR